MASPHGYVAIPPSPSTGESGATSPLLEEKSSSLFNWAKQGQPTQPIALPLNSVEADALDKQRKRHSKRRFLHALLFLFGAALLYISFFGRGVRFGSGCIRRTSSRIQDAFTMDGSGGSVADVFHGTNTVTSHLHVYKTSGAIQGEYTLQPGHDNHVVVGPASVEELAPRGYSTSAHLWTQSGSIDVGVRVIEEDDLDAEKKTKGTLLTAGSQSGSVKVHLHSRPSSSPVSVSLRATSGSVHAFLPGSFSGPFRIHTGSGSLNFGGTIRDRAVIERDIDGHRSGWIYADDDLLRKRTSDEHEESLMISSQSGSVMVTDD